MNPCLLRSHRTWVSLIGVEGFPHSGFRHFIRYINVRGVTPGEQGEKRGSGSRWWREGRSEGGGGRRRVRVGERRTLRMLVQDRPTHTLNHHVVTVGGQEG